jgi:hypothetical protein
MNPSKSQPLDLLLQIFHHITTNLHSPHRVG